ncbi:MAG: TlpA disulfide reductase family protein [Chloroflexi bacterium]|nr:TlpA disulfide reductase family protein [Chloroflexota bacterium]
MAHTHRHYQLLVASLRNNATMAARIFQAYRVGWLTALAGFLLLAGGVACPSPVSDLEPGDSGETPQKVADFEINLYQGEEALGEEVLSLSDLEGQPVVLNYWAGLCPPCRAEMPEFQEFGDEYEGRVTLVGVDMGQFLGLGSKEDARKLLAELGVSYPAGFTDDPKVVESHRVLGLPTTIFINGDGTLHRKWDGVLNKAKLSELADEMLAGEGG